MLLIVFRFFLPSKLLIDMELPLLLAVGLFIGVLVALLLALLLLLLLLLLDVLSASLFATTDYNICNIRFLLYISFNCLLSL